MHTYSLDDPIKDGGGVDANAHIVALGGTL